MEIISDCRSFATMIYKLVALKFTGVATDQTITFQSSQVVLDRPSEQRSVKISELKLSQPTA